MQIEEGIGTILLHGNTFLNSLVYNLKGQFQQKNLLGVLAVLEILKSNGWKIHKSAIRSVLEKIIIKARWQILQQKPLIICDGAHNLAGMQYALAELNNIPAKQQHLILGFTADKEIEKLLQLLPKTAYYYFTNAPQDRALAAKDLQDLASKYALKGATYANVNLALDACRSQAEEEDSIFIGGSLYLLADLEEL
ncbi:MAG: cyanophycin synthetase [Spirochaetota bacterium]